MNESVLKTIGVAFAVCLVCSLIVSISAVSLREQQKENKLNDRRLKVLEVAGIKIQPDQTIAEQFSNLEQKFVDFDTGRLMDEYNNFDIDEYDQLMSTRDTNLSSLNEEKLKFFTSTKNLLLKVLLEGLVPPFLTLLEFKPFIKSFIFFSNFDNS